jgi:nucleotide sugar dehydrogenase
VLTGRVFADLRRYPKLIGGIDESSAKRAAAFYEAVLDFDDRPDLDRPNGVWDLGSAEAAEFAKLAETTYRDVNIALANEFARFADRIGVDFSQVAEAANSQPYSHLHRPGIAVGGHCIPVYPRFYLSEDAEAKLPAAARQVNDSMPGYAADLLEELVGPLADQTVVVLGAAYRGGVKETAFSGVFPFVAELAARGATPRVHDPLYTTDELQQLGFQPHVFGDPCDAAVVQTDHGEYRELAPADLPGIRALVDGRNITTAEAWKNLPRRVIGRAG